MRTVPPQACYSALVSLYFLHTLTYRADFTETFAHPIDAKLARWLQSPASLSVLERGCPTPPAAGATHSPRDSWRPQEQAQPSTPMSPPHESPAYRRLAAMALEGGYDHDYQVTEAEAGAEAEAPQESGFHHPELELVSEPEPTSQLRGEAVPQLQRQLDNQLADNTQRTPEPEPEPEQKAEPEPTSEPEPEHDRSTAHVSKTELKHEPVEVGQLPSTIRSMGPPADGTLEASPELDRERRLL